MTTKISKITDTFSGSGPGSIYSLNINPETIDSIGPSLSNTATLEVIVIINDISSASTGSLHATKSYYNVSGTLGFNVSTFIYNFDSNCTVAFGVVGSEINISVTPITAVQTDGRIWIDIKAYS